MICLSFALAPPAFAAAGLDTTDPAGFFNNLADRLLRAQYGFGVTNIPVFTNNTFAYSPGIHRLLQLTANIYDATTNRVYPGATNEPFLPTVFRPRFEKTGNDIYITGFVEVTNANFLAQPLRDLADSDARDALQPDDLVYGVPLVIGAKKGFPNFNEFSMQSVVQMTRKLQITRPTLDSSLRIYITNQMFIIGISNVLGVEMWNSYRSNYTRGVDILVDCDLTMVLTNQYGTPLTINGTLARYTNSLHGNISTNNWQGYSGLQSNYAQDRFSFLIPLVTNKVFLPDAVYQFSGNQLITNLAQPYDVSAANTFPVPQWALAVTNKLRCTMVDTASGRVIDCVQLNALNDFRRLTEEAAIQNQPGVQLDGCENPWDTNRIGGTTMIYPPQGVINQIQISLGNISVPAADWQRITLGNPLQDYEIASYLAFYSPDHNGSFNGVVAYNTNLVQDVPFVPTTKLSKYWTWPANDPLVHYMTSDLLDLDLLSTNQVKVESLKAPIQVLANLTNVNRRYQPWAGDPFNPDPRYAYNLALMDPLIIRSDDWDFPSGEPLSFAMLGRVHRGTPWQTVYFKTTNLLSANGLNTWKHWTGNPNDNDATHTAPVQDRLIIDPLISACNTNDPRQLLSVSAPDTNAWLGVLDGILVLTNISFSPPQFDSLVMSSNSPQAALIADAIRNVRINTNLFPNALFKHLGDILAVPELAEKSLFLNTSSASQFQRGITDEAYEMIPGQLLMRLRPDSIASFAQTGGAVNIQFTGFDDYSYAVEGSSNLVDWLRISTNSPTNGAFEFIEAATPDEGSRFYRSAVLP